jgi:integrase
MARSGAAVRKVGVYPIERVKTKTRSGETGSGYRVRWRVYRTDGTEQVRKQTFRTRNLAETFEKRLLLAEVGKGGWTFDTDGLPVPAAQEGAAGGATVWSLAVEYWAEHWRLLSPAGRKAASFAMSGLVSRAVLPDAGTPAAGVDAYLAKVAWRSAGFAETEPPEEVRHGRRTWSRDDLVRARTWLASSSLPLSEVTPRTIQLVVTGYGDGRSAATENRRWSALRAMLRWAHESDLIDRDLTRGVRPRQADSDDVDPDRIPSVEEMWAMSEACGAVGAEWRALPLLLGGAGPRIGEVIALRRRHVREHGASGGMWIDIRRSVTRNGSDWGGGQAVIYRGTKGRGEGNKAGRTTYLPAAEAAVLRQHLADHVADDPDAFVFGAHGNRPLDLGHLSERVWKPAREAAFPAPHRLEAVGRHDFRHLACTRWLNSGMPLKTAQRWSGHKTLSILLNTYAACLPLDDERAVDAMEHSAGS